MSYDPQLAQTLSQIDQLRAQVAELEKELCEARKDSGRLDELGMFLSICGNAIVAFNDDPDVECDDSDNGFMPVGYRLAAEGCDGGLCFVGGTLREAIDKEIADRESKETES